MKAQWKGPYIVLQKINNVNYKVNVGGRRGIVTYHINLLRKYHRAALLAVSETDDIEDSLQTPDFVNDESVNAIKFAPNLSAIQPDQLRELCITYSGTLTTKPGKTKLVTHNIRTTDSPIRLKPYRIPHSMRNEIKNVLDEMQKHGIIRPSCSPYSAPIVPIRKKDSSLRICVDYRKLNNVTLFDAYPAPHIDELFEQLGDAEYISRLDMSKGYFQVPLSPQSQEKSAFVTPFGQFEFTVMPFGMKTSAATFPRLMDKLLNDLENTVAYFDDIVVYSQSWDI